MLCKAFTSRSCRINGSPLYGSISQARNGKICISRLRGYYRRNKCVQISVLSLSLFCRTFFTDSLCFGSCNVALLCDNLIIENYENRCFACWCAETSVFAFRFDFAQMGGTLWSPHIKATFWNSSRILHIGCGKLNSCSMSFSIYRRSLTQR